MIQLNNLSFNYNKRKPLFEDLNLQIEQGNIYGLLGKNGAGKTTLLRIISGLIFPKAGTIEVLGYTPKDRQPAFLSDLYYVSEEIHVPNVSINSFETLYAPFYPKYNDKDFDKYLRDFEIDRQKHFRDLSYGQKKKVNLAFGLATNAALLILDEPTNGLDIPSKSQFRKTLASAITDDRTFIVSTHQVRDMANLIDPIIILEDSKIIFQESIESITQRLSFGIQYEKPNEDMTLFSERVPGGYQVVTQNLDGEETDVELESLFNAVTMNKQKISQLFQKQVYHES